MDFCSKYVWVILLRDKKDTTITDAFQTIFHDSGPKSNKTWVDQSKEFYHRSMKS